MNWANAVMDLILMGLLLAALGFGVRLDKRLKTLRAGQEAFAQAVRDLDDAAIRAHNSLKDLRSMADESQELLHGRVMAAREALNRLETQMTRAERVQIEMDKRLSAWDAAASLRAVPISPSPTMPSSTTLPPAPDPSPAVVSSFGRDTTRSMPPPPMVPRRSRLPAAPEPVENEVLDKVQMSELVVANLNEMIRALERGPKQASHVPAESAHDDMPSQQTPRSRQRLSFEDDLFGDYQKR